MNCLKLGRFCLAIPHKLNQPPLSFNSTHHMTPGIIQPKPMDTPQAPIDAALHHAAFAVLPGRAFFRITGADAGRWLNGMVTNAAQALAPGEGNYNFLLNSQGRIQADCTTYREDTHGDPTFLLATDAAQIDAITQHLEKFIIMDDVELTPALDSETSLLLLGPEAAGILARLDLPAPEPLHLAEAATPHGPVLLLTGQQPQNFELRSSTATLMALRQSLEAEGVPELPPGALDQLRILHAIPRYGIDVRDRELPQETAQTHALHFSKGCYLGQEIVERIHSRGQVNRLFTPLRLQGTVPTLPAVIEANGKSVGEITSAAWVDLPSGPELLALGYVRREALAVGSPTASLPAKPNHGDRLTYPGGTATPRTTC